MPVLLVEEQADQVIPGTMVYHMLEVEEEDHDLLVQQELVAPAAAVMVQTVPAPEEVARQIEVAAVVAADILELLVMVDLEVLVS
jgi:hypothetical protein